jgi:Spy/CpxP family protein refolding chaperone
MKTFIKLSILSAGIFSSSLLPANAAVADAARPALDGGPSAQPAHRVPPLRRMVITQRIARKLGLTAEQKSQLKTVRQSTAAALKAIRADGSLTPDQKKTKARDILAASRTQMRSVLTPEQQQKFQHLRARLRNRQMR